MILEYARKKGGVIVTRDQYRDSYDRCPEFKETIEKRYKKFLWIFMILNPMLLILAIFLINYLIRYNRLLQFNFINDDVIFPRDPLGKSGPSLEQFLRF